MIKAGNHSSEKNVEEYANDQLWNGNLSQNPEPEVPKRLGSRLIMRRIYAAFLSRWGDSDG